MPYSQVDYDPYREGELFTQEEVEKAIHLKYQCGLSWKDVGERLGRMPNSLSRCMVRYRRGEMRFLRLQHNAVLDQIVSEVVAGSTIASSARRHGLLPHSVHQCLKNRGYDREIFDEMRKDGAIR